MPKKEIYETVFQVRIAHDKSYDSRRVKERIESDVMDFVDNIPEVFEGSVSHIGTILGERDLNE